MNTRKHARPQLETLESMTLLSGMGATLHAGAHVRIPSPPPAITPAPLTGSLNGTYVGIENGGQTSASYRFYGVGRVNPIGISALNGNVQLSGLVTNGSGTSATVSLNGSDDLYLHGRRGMLTLQLATPLTITTSGSTYSNSAQLTTTYTVTAATGAYSGEVGETGTVNVSLHSYIPSFVHVSRVDVGHFTLSFSTATAAA